MSDQQVLVVFIVCICLFLVRIASCVEAKPMPVSGYTIGECAKACGVAGVQSVTDAACTCKGAEEDGE